MTTLLQELPLKKPDHISNHETMRNIEKIIINKQEYENRILHLVDNNFSLIINKFISRRLYNTGMFLTTYHNVNDADITNRKFLDIEKNIHPPPA